jgi:hypothetical protein
LTTYGAPKSSGGRGGRTEARDAGGGDRVGDPGDQRRLRTDDHEVGTELLRQGGHGVGAGRVDGVVVGQRGGPGVARRGVQRLHLRVTGEGQHQGVLAAA